jgi:sulfatase modifying factor 1
LKRARTVVSFALLLMPACASLLDIEDRFVDSIDASTPPLDAPSDSPPDAPKPDASECPHDMVLVPAPSPFCIDATEVTQRAYASFLVSGDAGAQVPACAWNTDLQASTTCKPFTFNPLSDYPMVCIDWCDAYAYCASVGRRLCGAVGGGGLDAAADLANTQSDQWFSACSHGGDGKHAYPYGNDYDGSACNTRDIEAGTLLDAGSRRGCAGGYDGIYDMSGNAGEWEDDCRPTSDPDAAADNCNIRGGSYMHGSDYFSFLLACNGVYPFATRVTTSIDIGFRCCLDVK